MDIEDFIQKIQWSLENWIDNHSDYCDMTTRKHGDACLAKAIMKLRAEHYSDSDFIGFIRYCGVCGVYRMAGRDLLDYSRCKKCGCFCMKIDHEETAEALAEIFYYDDLKYYLPDHLMGEVDLLAYEIWIENYFPGIPGCIEDAQAALDDIADAEDPGELLAAVVMALHCTHMSGNIVGDYSGLSWDDIDMVQQDGLTALFDEKEINEYLGIWE